MSIWNILELPKTTDKKKIKKAYHSKLRTTHPEEDPEGFMLLRNAYESALRQAEEMDFYEEEDDFSYFSQEGEEEEYEYEEEWEESSAALKQRNEEEEKWWKRFEALYGELEKRWDSRCWYQLLYEDIPFQLQHYGSCRERLESYLFDEYEVFLPEEVWKVIDGFFDYSGTDVERSDKNNSSLRERNQRIKLNEKFDFSKFDRKADAIAIDTFCRYYALYIDSFFLPEYRVKEREKQNYYLQQMEKLHVFYLPFACMDLAVHFEIYKPEKIREKIKELENRAGDSMEIRLLQAEYALYQKEKSAAAELLKKLVSEVDRKNFVMIYQLQECCFYASMYYEAWTMAMALAWLRPEPVIFERAEKSIEKACGKESQTEPLHICRLYLQQHKIEKAGKILGKIKEEEKGWEYRVCACLYALATQDIREAKEQEKYLEDWEEYLQDPWKERELFILQLRILFEEKKYEEVIAGCNELLEQYPSAYDILLLRAHGDYCTKEKRYRDIDRMIAMNPNDVNVRILSASILYASEEEEDALNVLLPVKKMCPIQVEYLQIKQMEHEDYREYDRKLFQLFRKVMKKEYFIEAKSRHRLLDLNEMFIEMARAFSDIESKEEFDEKFAFLHQLEQSKYNHPEEYMDMQEVYYMAGMYEESVAVTREWMKKETDEKEIAILHRLIFMIYCKGNQYDKAEKEIPFFKGIETARIYELMGDTYQWAGNYEEAEKCWKKAIEKKYRIDAYEKLANYYYDVQGDEEKALEIWKEGIRLLGDDAGAYLDLADLYRRMGRYDEAIENLKLMRKYADDDYVSSQYYFMLGNIYGDKECYEKAIQYYEKSREENCPIHPSGCIAICLYALGRYEEARELFQDRAYKQNEVHLIDLFIIQHCNFFLNGKPDKALAKELQREIENRKEEFQLSKRRYYFFLGEAAAAQGRFAQAEKYFAQAEQNRICVDCGIKCHEVLWGKAWMYIYQKKYNDAILCLKQACEREPRETTMNVDYAEVVKMAGAAATFGSDENE